MLANNTKKALRSAARKLLAVGAIIIGVVGAADDVNAQALTGIRNTRHNLSAEVNGVVGGRNKSSAGEICVFCHTPHGSATTAAAPLWNKKLADPTAYTLYTSTTLDGTSDLTNSVSLACLTCHDGTQAMDTVLNAPGSGGYDPNGARMTGVTWSGANVDATSGKLVAAAVTNLGSDLSNDHPVGIQYANSSVGVLDPDFHEAQKVTGKNVWYVDSKVVKGTNDAKDKYDMILYTKNAKPYVECASCHDPHSDENATFLRISNSGSAVCLTCHNK
ncbi:MAG: cytochrome c3 family protein [Rhodospirillaceae bacterium]|nr:cytochrome c3 family protein [Rhodospirillales bacterium]